MSPCRVSTSCSFRSLCSPPCCSWCFKSTPKEIKREARARAYPPPPLAVGSRIQLALAGRAGPYLLHVSNVPALSPWGHQIAVRLQGFALDIARGSGRVDKNIACTHVASACTHAPPPSVRTYYAQPPELGTNLYWFEHGRRSICRLARMRSNQMPPHAVEYTTKTKVTSLPPLVALLCCGDKIEGAFRFPIPAAPPSSFGERYFRLSFPPCRTYATHVPGEWGRGGLTNATTSGRRESPGYPGNER